MITSLNILSGSIAVMFALSGDLVTAAIFILLGIFFDFFDGLAARLLKAQSEIGLQLDSLADVITSGLAPAVIMFQLMSQSMGMENGLKHWIDRGNWNFDIANYFPFLGLMIVVAAAYRLAKFNVDTRQSDGFIGLPTPANALIVLSFPLILAYQSSGPAVDIILNPWFLTGITLLGCVLMNAEIPLFSLKFKTWDFKSNSIRYVFILISILLLILLKFLAIPLLIAVYVLLSLIKK